MRVVAIIFVTLAVVSCSKPQQASITISGKAFGTTYNITYYPTSDIRVRDGIESVLDDVNRSVNTYVEGSDISRINRGDSTVVVDKIFREVYLLSEEVYNASEGYFDPTIGVLRNAYGFGDVKPIEALNDEVLDSLRQYVGFEKVKLTSEGTIEKKHPEIYFDFNAVAKGYGIDLIGEYLKSIGIDNFLIELGGEILASGKNLNRDSDWTVGVESIDSDANDRSFEEIITISNMALAASGNYRKFRIDSISGKKYVHTINPLTGRAEQGDVTSATVVASNCAKADAYATAFMAMGLKRSIDLLSKDDTLEAYLTYVDSTDTPQVFITGGFKKRIRD
jgi:thiamine biosynthesis lipoprotein